jgi:hypothetical protein
MLNMEGALGTIAPLLVTLTLIQIISLWRIFLKAGRPGWASIIPIYNYIVLLEIIKKPAWWFILLLIPVVNVVYSIWIANLLAKSFGRGPGFTVGLIFLGYIFYPILAFGTPSYLYEGYNSNYDDLSGKTRSWLVISSLIAWFIFPLLYAFFREGGLLGLDNYQVYATLSGVFGFLLGILPFLLGISVKLKYRHLGITISVCYIIVNQLGFVIIPFLSAT